MTANVWLNPVDIRDTLTRLLPGIECRGEVDDQGFALHCSVTGIRSFSFRRAVDARQCLLLFERVVTQHRLQQRVGGEDLTFDVERISLDTPLHWQKFQRAWYERAGARCFQVLERYLNSHEEDAELLRTLTQLGLAPSQLAASYSDADLAYFEQFLAQHPPHATHNSPLFRNLELRYPSIFALFQERALTQSRNSAEGRNYRATLEKLRERVTGQDYATERVASLLNSQSNSDVNGVLLFVGPAGVGKSELAKALGSIKGENDRPPKERLITLTMERYKDDHSSIFEVQPGYVGSQDLPHFAQELERFSPEALPNEGEIKRKQLKNVVILFDELEKAHRSVKQSLLSLFEEGVCVVKYVPDGRNVTVKYIFKRCLFIGTSNLYNEEVAGDTRNGVPFPTIEENFKRLNISHPTPYSFSPEFLRRMEPVPFGPIPREVYTQLLRNKMPSLLEKLKRNLNCLSVKLDPGQEERVIGIMKERLYGDGTSISNVGKYFDRIKAVVDGKRVEWGDLSRMDLALSTLPTSNNLQVTCVLPFFHKATLIGTAEIG